VTFETKHKYRRIKASGGDLFVLGPPRRRLCLDLRCDLTKITRSSGHRRYRTYQIRIYNTIGGQVCWRESGEKVAGGGVCKYLFNEKRARAVLNAHRLFCYMGII
jgi:hypothetical protein